MNHHHNYHHEHPKGLKMHPFEANEILPGLYLGNAHDAENIPGLRDRHIRYILNVADDVLTPNLPSGFIYERLDVADGGRDPGISRVFPKATRFYTMANTNKDGNMLVHCKYGINRSAAIMVLLVKHITGMSLQDSYNYVASRRRINILPDNQKELINYFHDSLRV